MAADRRFLVLMGDLYSNERWTMGKAIAFALATAGHRAVRFDAPHWRMVKGDHPVIRLIIKYDRVTDVITLNIPPVLAFPGLAIHDLPKDVTWHTWVTEPRAVQDHEPWSGETRWHSMTHHELVHHVLNRTDLPMENWRTKT